MADKKFMKELEDLSDQDLSNKIESDEREYMQLKFDHSTKGLDNPIQLRSRRRNIARMKMELRRRELEAAPEAVIAKRARIRKRRRNQ